MELTILFWFAAWINFMFTVGVFLFLTEFNKGVTTITKLVFFIVTFFMWPIAICMTLQGLNSYLEHFYSKQN
jgi:hypothetical protein